MNTVQDIEEFNRIQGYTPSPEEEQRRIVQTMHARDDYLLGRHPSTAGPQPRSERLQEAEAFQATQAEQQARREAREREMACMRDCRPPLSYEPRCHVPDCPWWAHVQEVHEQSMQDGAA